MVTGDGDLGEALREVRSRRRRRIYVVSEKNSLASNLHPFVKRKNDTTIWLDDLLAATAQAMAQKASARGRQSHPNGSGVTTTTASHHSLQPPLEGPISPLSSVGSQHESKHSNKFMAKCEAGRSCTRISDKAHLNDFLHPCPQWSDCPLLLPEAEESTLLLGSDTSASLARARTEHFKLFVHPCREGLACSDQSPQHRVSTFHPPPPITKKMCRRDCEKAKEGPHHDLAHSKALIHPCFYGRRCRYLPRKPDLNARSSKMRRWHLTNWPHPCTQGNRCPCLDELWNWEHMRLFIHPNQMAEADLDDADTDDSGVDAGVVKLQDQVGVYGGEDASSLWGDIEGNGEDYDDTFVG